MKEIIIIGSGGHAKVIIDILERSNKKIYGILDDDLNKKELKVLGYSILGTTKDIEQYKQNYSFIIGIGNNTIRKKIAIENKDLNYEQAIDPSAIISKNIKIGTGTVIMPGVIINIDSKIGNHCIINTGAIIEHDNIIEDYVHISPGVSLGGTVKIGETTHVGIGSKVINNIEIKGNVKVGAGAVVINNIQENILVIGVPAIKK
ncbi:MAG: acetyltransferase [Cetobacterium sp.]|nr:acetyltransferase [Cetobacterium sp.]